MFYLDAVELASRICHAFYSMPLARSGINSMKFQIKRHQFLSLFFLVALFCRELQALEVDSIIPESFSHPQTIHLNEKSERQAEAMACFLEAIFEEEADGPERALATKRRVLTLDPGFVPLALEVANQYLRRGEAAEALSVLKDAAKASPKDPAPSLALATIYLRQLNKPNLAEKYALQALVLSPDNISPYEVLWEVYRSTGQSQKIEKLFEKAMERENVDAEFWLQLTDLKTRDASRKHQSSIPQELEVLLDRAAARANDDPLVLARVADYFLAHSNIERAMPLYRQALDLKPSLISARKKLAECLRQTGEITQAIAAFEEIVRLDPLDLYAYDQLAELHLKRKDASRALASLRQSLLIALPDPQRYETVIVLSLSTNDIKSALETATEAEKQFPGALEFSIYRAIALSRNKQHEEAMKAFEKAYVEAGNSRPDLLNSDFYFNYGVAAEQADRIVKAAELLRKSIELDPENSARAYNYLGYMWADRNENLDEAEQLIQRALELDPENGAYLDSLGWVYFHKGKYSEAIEELLRAAAALPEQDAVVYEHIGDTYEKLNKIAEAVLYWQKALQLAPENKALITKLDTHAAHVVQQPKPSTSQIPTH